MNFLKILPLLFCVTFADSNFRSEEEISAEHLGEHFSDKIDLKPTADETQRSFLYFKLADTNIDSNLDGIEIMKIMSEHAMKQKENLDLEQHVDDVLRELDANNDGFVDFSEYSQNLHKT